MSAYRQNPLANVPPVTRYLLIANVICFVPYLIFNKGENLPNPYINTFGVFYFNSPMFKPWQIITHMFMHGGWFHIIFNMFALYSFGPILEYILGQKRFFNFYFICGLGAIALQMLVQAIELHSLIGSFTVQLKGNIVPGTLPEMQSLIDLQLSDAGLQKIYDILFVPMVGASGAIFGVLIGFGYLLPNAELMIMFIPVPVKAKYIIPVYIAYELFSGVGEFAGDSVAHFAHLGGALLGFILIKIWHVQRPKNMF